MSSLLGIAAGSPSTNFYGFEISNSLRFNIDNSPQLNRGTLDGNEKTFTYSIWVKRAGTFSTNQPFFHAWNGSSNRRGQLSFDNSDQILWEIGGNSTFRLITTRLFRDPSAWLNIVAVADITNSTQGDRLRLYVNGTRITSFSTENQVTNASYSNGSFNNDNRHDISGIQNRTSLFDGYMAEINFIDGQALDASSFGETKSGVWIPKDTAGLTFGTTGFRLQFKQTGTGSGTATTVGADTSGIASPNHFSSLGIVSADVFPDTPTDNFATLNPLINNPSLYGKQSTPTPTNANLSIAMPGGTNNIALSTMQLEAPNKYRCTFNLTSRGSSTNFEIGICEANTDINNGRVFFHSAGNIGNESGYQQTGLTDANTVGDTVEMLVDLGANNVKFALKENGSSTWASLGTAESITANTNNPIVYVREQGSSNINGTLDFGQSGYTSSDNSYSPMSTANLPEPTFSPKDNNIPENYFNTVLYTGNESTRSITGVGFQPDWVWIKCRNVSHSSRIFDSVRGATKGLNTNGTNAEFTETGLTSFDSDGFSLGPHVNANDDSSTFVAWNWRAGTAFSNDASATSIGSIDSSGSVNTQAGFSIIKYTGTGSSMTFAHGLGATPDFLIIKRLTASDDWMIYPLKASGNLTGFLRFDSTTGGSDSVLESVTSTVIGLGSSGARNDADDDYICYAFTEITGYSKFGKYTGNSDPSGTFVHTGFKPAWVLNKISGGGTGHWHIYDNKRGSQNEADSNVKNTNELTKHLYASVNNTEGATTDADLDFLSNGFKWRGASSGTTHQHNVSDDTYVYMAFAEMPFKYANAR